MPEQTEPKRQYVNFLGYKLNPAWRHLPEEQKKAGREELSAVIARWQIQDRMMILPFSMLGLRADVDIMLWRIGCSLEDMEQMVVEIHRTGMGKYLEAKCSLLSMTKRSTYLIGHEHEGQVDSRGTLIPGRFKYIFIYPFVKSREWYLLNLPTRQGMMNEHIVVGHKDPRVKLNTTYSFGLDDQDFVVAFESDYPEDFVDLVMELRETDASKYTVRDTPIFTGILKTVPELLENLC
jgi:chlorite dismutase